VRSFIKTSINSIVNNKLCFFKTRSTIFFEFYVVEEKTNYMRLQKNGKVIIQKGIAAGRTICIYSSSPPPFFFDPTFSCDFYFEAHKTVKKQFLHYSHVILKQDQQTFAWRYFPTFLIMKLKAYRKIGTVKFNFSFFQNDHLRWPLEITNGGFAARAKSKDFSSIF